jgi:hypothetical protein
VASSMPVPILPFFEASWSQSYSLRLRPGLHSCAASWLCTNLGLLSLGAALADLRNQDNQHVSIGVQDFPLRVSVPP